MQDLKMQHRDPFSALLSARLASPNMPSAQSQPAHSVSADPNSVSCLRDGPRIPYGSENHTPLLLPHAKGVPVLQAPWILRSTDGEHRLCCAKFHIGSGPENDLVIHDRFVSKHHTLLSVSAEKIEVHDLQSRNGTFLNGVRLQKGELREGGVLRMGQTELQVFRQTNPSALGLVGDSPAMAKLRGQITSFAPSVLPVLLLGESGTGKELVAKAIHDQSGRSGPLVPINCGALPRELIESELFGHEKGAFTGAARRHLGCFAEAEGGTLFLDEIGELPLDLQPRLLRALENHTIRPVGSSRELPIHVRIVAATHKDLSRQVREGRFRADLFYRLAGLVMELPPLRARRSDIPQLVRFFVNEASAQIPGLSIDDEELEALSKAPWPGNVRQLKMAVLRAAHLYGRRLKAKDVLSCPQLGVDSWDSDDAKVPILGRKLIDIERDVFSVVLRHTNGNQRDAANMLKLPKSSFHDRARRLGIVTNRAVQISVEES